MPSPARPTVATKSSAAPANSNSPPTRNSGSCLKKTLALDPEVLKRLAALPKNQRAECLEAVCIHEFGHAWAAYRGGDYTVRDKGYLTLNPLHYTHPVYSLLMPVVFMMLGSIGLPGGAVYIERHLLKSRAWDTWVSLAGPAMNVPMVLIISLCFKIG